MRQPELGEMRDEEAIKWLAGQLAVIQAGRPCEVDAVPAAGLIGWGRGGQEGAGDWLSPCTLRYNERAKMAEGGTEHRRHCRIRLASER